MSSFVRFEADQPNERWQLDVTHWALSDGTDIEILNQVDDHSRLLVGCDARRVFKAADVVASFRQATARHGLPAQLLSDNGAVFTGIPRGGGRVALELELAAPGIGFRHSRPYHPQTCGKVERFHQTLVGSPANPGHTRCGRCKPNSTPSPGTTTPAGHNRALHRRTPAEAFGARPKAMPTGQSITEGHYRVRHDRVHAGGVITLRHDSKLHHIGLGRRYGGSRVLVLVHDLHVRVLNEHGELIRELTLDPRRDFQRQARS